MFNLSIEIETRGFAIASNVISRDWVDRLLMYCSHTIQPHQAKRHGESAYGVRRLLNVVPELRDVLTSTPFIELARGVQGNATRPVKGTYFDKTSDANWPVPWHQDVTITVKERREVPDYEMRPVKDGFVHVLPPVEISEQLLALRIHLDDADADHGALRVIPGSHRHGRLDTNGVKQCLARSHEEVAAVKAGDIMLMRPLLLHASSPCRHPNHRRVIHVEYAAFDLPGGLEWAG